MQTSYETDRLILKIPDEAYAEAVLDYYIRNTDFLKEWEANKTEEFYTLDIQAKQLKHDLNEIYNERLLRLWLFKKDEENRVIGTIGFSNIVKGAFYSCFLGYKLDKEEINKGYMTEALIKGISIMFDHYKLHRLEANIMPRNSASLKVVEKLGFYNEGISKKYLKINNKWEDHIHMVLLNEKFE